MRYRVTIQPMAVVDLDEVFVWIAEQSPEHAMRWYERLLDDVLSLASFPQRCPTALESVRSGKEIRQLLFGDYRILFTIDAGEVRVLRVRHGMRRPLR